MNRFARRRNALVAGILMLSVIGILPALAAAPGWNGEVIVGAGDT